MLGKKVNAWSFNELSIIETNKNFDYVYALPNHCSKIFDCMDNKQLTHWFSDYIRKIDTKIYEEISRKIPNWKVNIEEHLKLGNSNNELDAVRLRRFISHIEEFKMTKEHTFRLIEESPKLKKHIENYITKNREEFSEQILKDQEELLKKLKLGEETEKKRIDKELDLLKKRTKELETQESKIKKKIAEKEKKLKYFKENYERLKEDFFIFSSSKNQVQLENSNNIDFYLNELVPSGENINDKDSFLESLTLNLTKHGITESYAEYFFTVFKKFNYIFCPSPLIPVAIFETFNNGMLLIQQVGCDWLNYSKFSTTGFKKICEFCNSNKDKVGILILEDINMSAPECWGRPLFDEIQGIRSSLPGINKLPSNLYIFATKLPVEEPALGVPLYEKTFLGWSAIKDRENIFNKQKNHEIQIKQSYVNYHDFQKFQIASTAEMFNFAIQDYMDFYNGQ